jgi:DNA-binding protein YbaB
MSDTNTNAPQDQQGASTATGTNASLVNELRAFGTQIEAVARAFLASNQAQQIQQELQRGVGELVDRLQTVRSDERVVEATEKGKQAVERALTNPAVIDAHAKVVQGLANINEELRKLATSLENDRNDTKPSA